MSIKPVTDADIACAFPIVQQLVGAATVGSNIIKCVADLAKMVFYRVQTGGATEIELEDLREKSLAAYINSMGENKNAMKEVESASHRLNCLRALEKTKIEFGKHAKYIGIGLLRIIPFEGTIFFFAKMWNIPDAVELDKDPAKNNTEPSVKAPSEGSTDAKRLFKNLKFSQLKVNLTGLADKESSVGSIPTKGTKQPTQQALTTKAHNQEFILQTSKFFFEQKLGGVEILQYEFLNGDIYKIDLTQFKTQDDIQIFIINNLKQIMERTKSQRTMQGTTQPLQLTGNSTEVSEQMSQAFHVSPLAFHVSPPGKSKDPWDHVNEDELFTEVLPPLKTYSSESV